MQSHLKVGPHIVNLFLQGKIPHAEVAHQIFPHFWPLVAHLPQLADLSYLEEFAIISNFFWKGGEFRYVESVEEYQKFYRDRVEFEKNNPADLLDYRLTDYRIFDVSVMHPPTVEKGFLYYYTCHKDNWVPYRVVCSFPYHLEGTHVHYQILPYT